VFAREYLAEWTSASGSFFDSTEIDDATRDDLVVDVDTDPSAARAVGWVTAGVDFGMRRDANALVVIGALPEPDERGRTRDAVRFVEERYRLGYEPWIERVCEVCRPGAFAVGQLVAELNGVGQMPSAVLERRLWEVTDRQCVEPVSTTAKLKEDLFGFARLLLQQGRLLLPKHPALLQQLRGLEFEISDAGNLRIAVPERVGHDDVAMAFAFALLPLMAGELVPYSEQVYTAADLFPELEDFGSYIPRF
jgi:hypothetical protein